jgi:predicted ArsR family transcriptional regulator
LVAAEMTMRAHLKKLIDEGLVRASTGSGDEVFEHSG